MTLGPVRRRGLVAGLSVQLCGFKSLNPSAGQQRGRRDGRGGGRGEGTAGRGGRLDSALCVSGHLERF
jgi:hypothetical protein